MKRACVIVAAAEPARIAEALRAAVGLCLRGGRVEVLLGAAARALVDAGERADASRAVATLAQLGQTVADASAARVGAAVAAADCVERWTDGAEAAIDDAEALRHVVAADPARLCLVRAGSAPPAGAGAVVADRATRSFRAGERRVDTDQVIALLFRADAAFVW